MAFYTDLRNEWALTPDSAGEASANRDIIQARAGGDRALFVPPGTYHLSPTTIGTARRIFGVSPHASILKLASAGVLLTCGAEWTILERLRLVGTGIVGGTGILGSARRLVLKDCILDGFDVDGVRHTGTLPYFAGVRCENCGDGFDLGGGASDCETGYLTGTAKSCTVGWRLRTGADCPGAFGHLDAVDCTTSHIVDSEKCAELTLAARGTGSGPTVNAATGYLLVQGTKSFSNPGGATVVQP